ncbi:50S ribosomal protein L21 [soil metagenome]
MYAVIRQGSHQYRVAPGDVIQIEKIEAEAGTEITIEDVLAVNNGTGIQVGEPRLGGAAVRAKVIRQGKSPKVEVFKFRRRKAYHWNYGHRQPFTEIRILGVSKDGKDLS